MLTETLDIEKDKRLRFDALRKQKKAEEESLKKQLSLRERSRDMGNHVVAQHSYPNPQMLISQTSILLHCFDVSVKISYAKFFLQIRRHKDQGL